MILIKSASLKPQINARICNSDFLKDVKVIQQNLVIICNKATCQQKTLNNYMTGMIALKNVNHGYVVMIW